MHIYTFFTPLLLSVLEFSSVSQAGPSCKYLNAMIIGGTFAAKKEFLYIASLRHEQDVHFCGGAILNERFIVTAAHCTTGINFFYAVVGTHTLTSGGVRHDIARIYKHKNYDTETKDNDIAMLKLKEKIEFSDYISPIKLYKNDIKADSRLVVSGWGREGPTQRGPVQLKFAPVVVMDRKSCHNLVPHWYITNLKVCATISDDRTCSGDSGGPLVHYNYVGEPSLVGLVSFGPAGCIKNYPTVYTRIAPFVPWIKKIIEKL